MLNIVLFLVCFSVLGQRGMEWNEMGEGGPNSERREWNGGKNTHNRF